MYDYAIDGYGRQLSEFQNRGHAIRYRYAKALDESQCYRIGCWINLLRNLKVQATPDVVAIYMIATGQRDLLSEFIRVPDRSYEPHNYDYAKDGGGCVPCCDYCCGYIGNEWVDAKSKFHAPAEAYKMARKYLDSRVEEFVKILTCTINSEARSIKPGQTVHPFIWNAVMNTSVDSSMNMELGSRMNIVKSLHAMLMPECISQCSESGYYTEPQYQMLGYEPEKYGINRIPHKVIITKEFCSRISAIASFGEWSLEYFFNKVRKDAGAAEFAEVKELICLISEAILFISQSAHGRSPRWFSHLPRIREINRLLWKDELESGGAGKYSSDMSCQNAENLMRLKNITPAGALCMGELLCTVPDFRCGDLNAYNCGYMTDYEIQMIENLLPRVSYTDMLNFMICESNWTTITASQVGQILDYQRREQANGPESRECCCERS